MHSYDLLARAKTLYRYAVVKTDTGELLGTTARNVPLASAEFGAGMPLLWQEDRGARQAFFDWCVARGFLRREISLPGSERAYSELLPIPDVVIRCVALTPTRDIHLSPAEVRNARA
jgi:hypothetical protein